MINALVTQPHYWDHLRPVWEALPAEARGTCFVCYRIARQTSPKVRLTLSMREWRGGPLPKGVALVAGWADLKLLKGEPAVLLQHGAGQSYGGDPHDTRALEHPAYPGGTKNDNVLLFVCPSHRVAQDWWRTYPRARTAVVGCPRLDALRDIPNPGAEGMILVAFNWGSAVSPEAGTARHHFAQALRPLSDAFPDQVIGTGHPRAKDAIRRTYSDAHISWVESDLQTLAEWSGVVCADNTSLAWELAALGVPVVWLDSPEYRPHIHHGLRFWQPQMHHATPSNLTSVVADVLADQSDERTEAQRHSRIAYEFDDDLAAKRASDAILGIL